MKEKEMYQMICKSHIPGLEVNVIKLIGYISPADKLVESLVRGSTWVQGGVIRLD